MAAKKGLQDIHKVFVIRMLACYESPKDVAAALKEEFGFEITVQGINAYDPTKTVGKDLSKKWVELFHKIRDDFHSNIEKYVPEANKTVRVTMLANAARAYKGSKNYGGMREMLEGIAKELGNVHTNKRELTGKDGKPVQVEFNDLTEDEINKRLLQLIGGDEHDSGH